MTGRYSGRFLEGLRPVILDNATRMRRLRKFLEAMESDNYQSDPHPDLKIDAGAVWYTGEKKKGRPFKKKRSTEYYKAKYNRTFSQLVEEDQRGAEAEHRPSYLDAAASEDPKYPKRHFCNVCGNVAPYTCVKCGVRFCSVRCNNTHFETRCILWSGPKY